MDRKNARPFNVKGYGKGRAALTSRPHTAKTIQKKNVQPAASQTRTVTAIPYASFRSNDQSQKLAMKIAPLKPIQRGLPNTSKISSNDRSCEGRSFIPKGQGRGVFQKLPSKKSFAAQVLRLLPVKPQDATKVASPYHLKQTPHVQKHSFKSIHKIPLNKIPTMRKISTSLLNIKAEALRNVTVDKSMASDTLRPRKSGGPKAKSSMPASFSVRSLKSAKSNMPASFSVRSLKSAKSSMTTSFPARSLKSAKSSMPASFSARSLKSAKSSMSASFSVRSLKGAKSSMPASFSVRSLKSAKSSMTTSFSVRSLNSGEPKAKSSMPARFSPRPPIISKVISRPVMLKRMQKVPIHVVSAGKQK